MVKFMAKGSFGEALAVLLLGSVAVAAADDQDKAKTDDKSAPATAVATAAGPKVSYDKQVRPIFQAHCQGCHQPAKAGGGYVMTAFDRLLKGGEASSRRSCRASRTRAISSSRSRPTDGKAEMPQDKPPLSKAEIELITRWIAQGAVDDTPRTPQAATTWTIRPITPARR